jgi:hypothetical protein
MTVQMPKPPPDATAALTSTIGSYLSRDIIAEPSAYTPDIGVPVFVVDQTNPLSIKDLSHLQPVAWRFVINRRKVPYATGDVTKTKGSFALSSVTEGKTSAKKLISAVDAATRAAQNEAPTDSFLLRVLEAPAFHVLALWLHGKKDDLFSMMQGQDAHDRRHLVTAHDFVKLLNHAQSSKLKSANSINYDDEPDLELDLKA